MLSACNTASGQGAGFEAVSSRGRAFFYAGARALLVSNWPVETTSARALTTDLFRRLESQRRWSVRVSLGWLTGVLNSGTPDSPVLISNNAGPGLLAETNATLGLANATVTGNTEDGIQVLKGAVANIGATPGGLGPGPVTIAGNGGADLACDTTALVFGDLSNVGTVDCKQIERENGPPRPGHIHDLSE